MQVALELEAHRGGCDLLGLDYYTFRVEANYADNVQEDSVQKWSRPEEPIKPVL